MMGYKDISTNDIWECLLEKVWKNQSFPPLYQVVQDILHLPIHVYMSYLTLNAYQVTDDDLMASIRAVTDNEIHYEVEWLNMKGQTYFILAIIFIIIISTFSVANVNSVEVDYIFF